MQDRSSRIGVKFTCRLYTTFPAVPSPCPRTAGFPGKLPKRESPCGGARYGRGWGARSWSDRRRAECWTSCPLSASGQFSSVAQSYPTLWDPMNRSPPGLPVRHQLSRSPPKPMSIESVMPSNHLILCHPLLLLPSALPSIRVFSNESALHMRWPKY